MSTEAASSEAQNSEAVNEEATNSEALHHATQNRGAMQSEAMQSEALQSEQRTALEESILTALSHVQDPELHRPLTELGMIGGVRVGEEECEISLLLTIAACPAADRIAQDVQDAVAGVPGLGARRVRVLRDVMSPEQRRALVEKVRGPRREQFGADSLTRVIAVTSGKGGVGKSSLTAGLALALSELGFRVGVVDADVYGFSIPRLLGATGLTPTRVEGLIIPPEVNGVKVISIGMFLGEKDPTRTAVSWRGPLLHRTLEQFLRDVWFGDIDFLLLDMPPGTGDVALSVTQLLPQAEVLVVTTPQPAASDVAVRSGLLAQQTGQRVLGVVENMSAVTLPGGGEFAPFGSGGGELVAERLREETGAAISLIAKVPFETEFGRACDAGAPLAGGVGGAGVGGAGAGASCADAGGADGAGDAGVGVGASGAEAGGAGADAVSGVSAGAVIRALAARIACRDTRAGLPISPA